MIVHSSLMQFCRKCQPINILMHIFNQIRTAFKNKKLVRNHGYFFANSTLEIIKPGIFIHLQEPKRGQKIVTLHLQSKFCDLSLQRTDGILHFLVNFKLIANSIPFKFRQLIQSILIGKLSENASMCKRSLRPMSKSLFESISRLT